MGTIFLYLIFLIIAYLCSVVGFFMDNVAIFDSLSLAIIAGVCGGYFLGIHPALCVLICAAVFAILMLLMCTSAGFWIISSIMAAVWGAFFAFLFLIFTSDLLWFIVAFVISFIIVLIQHIRQRI